MHNFTYHRAATIDEAAALLAKASDGNLLAGGQTIIPTLKQRLLAPSDLIDISLIKDLRFIKVSGDKLTIGAATTHAEVAASKEVKNFCAALASLAGDIGDPAVRHRGTIGGSIANNDPAADYPAACVALNAEIITQKRAIKADDFFTDLFETSLEPDEIIKEITFPKAERAAYVKFPQPASRYALVGVFFAQTQGAARIAVTGSGASGVFRLQQAEEALQKNGNLDDLSVSPDDLMDDIHADRVWRAHLIKVMTQRAVNG